MVILKVLTVFQSMFSIVFLWAAYFEPLGVVQNSFRHSQKTMNSSLLQASSLLVRFKDNANNVSAWWCSSVTETGNKKSMLTIFPVCKALKRAHKKTLKGTPIANALIPHDISLPFVASKTKNSRTSWCFYYQVPSSIEWDSWRETVRCAAP